MKKTVKYLVIIMMATLTHNASGQDHHFSQYDATIQYMNPALTGMWWDESFNWRINAAYRSQWLGLVSKPFTNQYVGFDMPWKKGIGLGGYIINNRAGAGYMNSLNIMLGAAYKISIDPTNIHNLYGGFQLGVFNRSLNISDLVFDSQFTLGSSGWESSQNSGEKIGDKSIWRVDANMGFYYRYNDNQKKYRPWGGFSLFRVTMPNESFTSEVIRMPIRWNFNAGCDIKINETLLIKPSLLAMFQGKAREYVVSVLADYKFENSPWAITGGFADRINDAFIIVLGAKYHRSQYRISYDINTSYLKNYTNSYGGFELTAIYIFDKGKSTSQHLLY